MDPQYLNEPTLGLRPARPEDAAQAVPLLVEAIDHIALELAGVPCRELAVPLFERLFRLGGQRYGHEHVLVLQRRDRVVGAALAYPGCDEADLAAPLAGLAGPGQRRSASFEAESSPDEFYLDALAVAADQRGQGHAQKLLEGICARAVERGFQRVGLLVDEHKPRLLDWYAALGFSSDGQRRVAGHGYWHMVRRLAG